jgi:hypothetical protein
MTCRYRAEKVICAMRAGRRVMGEIMILRNPIRQSRHFKRRSRDEL